MAGAAKDARAGVRASKRASERATGYNQLSVNSCRTVEARVQWRGSECSDALFCKESRARAHSLARSSVRRSLPPLRTAGSRLSYPAISTASLYFLAPPTSPLILFRSLSCTLLRPRLSLPSSSPAIPKSCRLFLRRGWQVYSRRVLAIVFIHTHTHTHEALARIVYALCMKSNKYKRVTRRARMGRNRCESEIKEKRGWR